MHQDTHVLGGAKNRLLQKLVKDGGGGAVRVHITSASSAVAGSALDTPTLKAIEACQVTCTLDCRLAVRTLENMPNSKIPLMQITQHLATHVHRNGCYQYHLWTYGCRELLVKQPNTTDGVTDKLRWIQLLHLRPRSVTPFLHRQGQTVAGSRSLVISG